MKPPEGFPTKDAVAAYRALSEYWRALADSDEEALSRLLSPATIERNGWTRGAMAGQIDR